MNKKSGKCQNLHHENCHKSGEEHLDLVDLGCGLFEFVYIISKEFFFYLTNIVVYLFKHLSILIIVLDVSNIVLSLMNPNVISCQYTHSKWRTGAQ